ncbi:MAG: hypothetical protein PF484_01935 [Bacteroidales bacterium]|jgi:hypothetical protein|nr:hypothetical protein [Bacteroidales bacterium]
MKKGVELFKKLTAYDHFLVFLIILSILKITDVFIDNGKEAGLHFIQLGAALFVISSLLFLAFKYGLDKRKKYKHVLISTFIILLVLSHGDPAPLRGLLVMLFLFVSKFLIKYKKQNIFNPVVFAIGFTTLLAMIIPAIGIPPVDWAGIDISFLIFDISFPLPIIPIILALIFNVARVRKHPLALSFIALSLLLGFFINAFDGNYLAYIISTVFIGTAIIVEPKTSPSKTREQIIYGIAMALVVVGFSVVKIPNAPIMGLMLGNMVYFLYKRIKLSK